MKLSIQWENFAVKSFSYVLYVHDYSLGVSSANFAESLYIIIMRKYLPRTVSN